MSSVFLSHISEEAELATLFKAEIETSFIGMVNVFQSSDPASNVVGRNWFDSITSALRDCQIIVLFCSPYSVKRPWINFECGAGWGRDIAVVPVCHTGIRPVELPVPISLLQGLTANDDRRLKEIFDLIASKLRSNTPTVDYTKLARNVLAFEAKYGARMELTTRASYIKTNSPDVFSRLRLVQRPDEVVSLGRVLSSDFQPIRLMLEELKHMNMIYYSYNANVTVTGGPNAGLQGPMQVSLTSKFMDAIKEAAKG